MAYQGRVATTGNSQALAFEKAFFRSHPEFASGRVEADVIAPNYLLVRAVAAEAPGEDGDGDPILGAYLAFLAEQMEANPQHIAPLSMDSIERARALVGDMEVDRDEDLGDDVDLD